MFKSAYYLITIIYNYCTSLSAIWCVMEHWKAICQCSITHHIAQNGSAVIVLLHIPSFFMCIWINFIGIVCWVFFKFKNTWAADPFNIRDTCTNSVCKFILLIQCVQIYICILLAFVKLLCHFLFVFVWHHCNARRKRLASKF